MLLLDHSLRSSVRYADQKYAISVGPFLRGRRTSLSRRRRPSRSATDLGPSASPVPMMPLGSTLAVVLESAAYPLFMFVRSTRGCRSGYYDIEVKRPRDPLGSRGRFTSSAFMAAGGLTHDRDAAS
jgi:hypothetical protein